MDFSPSPQAEDFLARLNAFLVDHVYPAEPLYEQQVAAHTAEGRPHDHPEVIEDLKTTARAAGLWNLFLPAESGLSNLDYAVLAEATGRSIHLAPEALNCSAPDTGNMEVLHQFGTPAQQKEWLEPLLDGTIRSGFAMTEPDVASSDARNISTRIVRDGDEYVINGRKWWTSGAADPRCRLLILMGKTDPDADTYHQQSMIIVPRDAPGVTFVRDLSVFGYHDQPGHGELLFEDVRVPVENLLGEPGSGFAIAQARLGPGRIHHCMRALGMAERALELMVRRAQSRQAFGGPISDQGVVRQQIAESRMEIEQARLLVLKTAWLIDQHGASGARAEVAAIKVITPRVAGAVIDRAIQVHGGGGVSGDFPLARMWAHARTLRLADGPDEVHIRSVAREELRRYR
jgi:acyl-CoA dehydrogenase